MNGSILAALIFGLCFLIGNQVHERYHYWTGKIFGADPTYAGGLAPIFPTRTEFCKRDLLTVREVQIVSIPGHMFFIMLVCLAIVPGFPSSYMEIAFVGVVAGGAIISWTDDMAARDPAIWLMFNDWLESEDGPF
jgi:hypothetical protein